MNTITSTISISFAIFLIFNLAVQMWLEKKNKRHILLHRDNVPDRFKEKVFLADHQKAADYAVEKSRWGSLFNAIELAIMIIWLFGGGLNLLDRLVRGYQLGLVSSGLLFFALFSLISLVLGLPKSIISTFFIEEKYGFNKTTPKLFIIDLIKGLVISAIIGLPLLAAVLWLMEYFNQSWWILAWALLTIFQFILMWAYPRIIAPLFNKFSPLEDGELKENLIDLFEQTGFKIKGLFVMDASKRSSHGNAYFTGFGKSKRIVLFDTLLKNLEPDEAKAVLAHELGHFRKKHIIKGLIRSTILSLIGFKILYLAYNLPEFYMAFGISTPSPYLGLILFSMVIPIYTFFLTPIFAHISRKWEFEADEFASKYSDPQKLISSLIKLYKDNASTLTPDPTYSAFYHSHPPAATRVDHLDRLSTK